MNGLEKIFHTLLDFLFGKGEIEKRIREISQDDFLQKMSPKVWNDGVISLFRYTDPLIHEMIWALKYRKNEHVATLFAIAIETHLSSLSITHAMLVPIPLSKNRLRERGYNQIDLILKRVIDHKHLPNILLKIQETKPQTSLHRGERMKNLKNAFALTNPREIAGKIVVLIDDVTTTGATLKEAQKVLIPAKPASVHIIAIAR